MKLKDVLPTGLTYPVDAQHAPLALGGSETPQGEGHENGTQNTEDTADDESCGATVDGATGDVGGDVDCSEKHDEIQSDLALVGVVEVQVEAVATSEVQKAYFERMIHEGAVEFDAYVDQQPDLDEKTANYRQSEHFQEEGNLEDHHAHEQKQ